MGPSGGKRGLAVLGALAILVLLTGGMVVVRGLGGSNPRSAEQTDELATAFPDLPDLATLELAAGPVAAEWHDGVRRRWEGDDPSRPPSTCFPDPGNELQYTRSYTLDATDGSGGYGTVSVILRRFETAAQADKFVAGHRGTEFEACMLAHRREQSVEAGWTVKSVDAQDHVPVDDGAAITLAQVRQRSGYTCAQIEDEYWNAVGRYAATMVFDTCSGWYQPASEVRVVRTVLDRFEDLTR